MKTDLYMYDVGMHRKTRHMCVDSDQCAFICAFHELANCGKAILYVYKEYRRQLCVALHFNILML